MMEASPDPKNKIFSGDCLVGTLVFDCDLFLQSENVSPDVILALLNDLAGHVSRIMAAIRPDVLNCSSDTFQMVWIGVSLTEGTLSLVLKNLAEIAAFISNYAELNAGIAEAPLSAHIGIDYGRVVFDGVAFTTGDAYRDSYRLAAKAKQSSLGVCISRRFVERFQLVEKIIGTFSPECLVKPHIEYYYSSDFKCVSCLI